jgi:hypothetical protein
VLFGSLRRKWLAWQEHQAHVARIMDRAAEALCAEYQVQAARIERLSRDPPLPMRYLPRPGSAWFAQFANPHVRGVVFVEVDDASERVTRIWTTPK